MEEPGFNRFGDNNLPYFLNKALRNREKDLTEKTQEAEMDPLTGIGNRRALDTYLPNLIQVLNQKEEKEGFDLDYVQVFFLDINKFKDINDNLGHQVGDQALKVVAENSKKVIEEELTREAQRRGGKAFRFAGDEFVLVQPGKGVMKGDIKDIALRIQLKMNSHLSVLIGDGKQLSFTVSVGGDVINKGEGVGKTVEELLKASDIDMYRKKREARAA